MNPTASPYVGASWLFWSLGTVVAMLTVHVGLEWTRLAQHQPTWRQRWRPLLLAGLTLGTGICSAMVLSLAGAALDFPLGYRAEAVAALWLGSSLVSAAVAAAISRSKHPLALQGCGAVMGGLAGAVQAGWIWAAGFRPGSEWQIEWLVGAAVLQFAGFGLGLWIAFAPAAQDRRMRLLRTLGTASLIGVTLIAGQQLMLVAADLARQVGSVYADDVPGWILSMMCGVLAPLVLAFMAVDLAVRRNQRRHRHKRRIPTT